jgi:hypothetical protein
VRVVVVSRVYAGVERVHADVEAGVSIGVCEWVEAYAWCQIFQKIISYAGIAGISLTVTDMSEHNTYQTPLSGYVFAPCRSNLY